MSASEGGREGERGARHAVGTEGNKRTNNYSSVSVLSPSLSPLIPSSSPPAHTAVQGESDGSVSAAPQRLKWDYGAGSLQLVQCFKEATLSSKPSKTTRAEIGRVAFDDRT